VRWCPDGEFLVIICLQKEVVQKDCQARNLNKEDAMDREADKDWMMIRMVGR